SKLARTTVDPVRSPRAVPLGSTERTRGSSLDHSTSARSRDLWSSSITLAVNTRSWPSETEAVPGSTVTRETTTGATTSVWQATIAVSAEIANTIRATDFLPIRVLQGVTSRPPGCNLWASDALPGGASGACGGRVPEHAGQSGIGAEAHRRRERRAGATGSSRVVSRSG